MYIRFVSAQLHEDSGLRKGVFAAAYELREMPDLDGYSAARLEELLAWFRQELPIPDRFNRSTSKGASRRNTNGVSWYKATALQMLAQVRDLVLVLEQNGIFIEVLRTNRVGFIVYEDAFQVVAEPFKETPS